MRVLLLPLSSGEGDTALWRKQLPEQVAGGQLCLEFLPCDPVPACRQARRALVREQPTLVILFERAAEGTAICLERIAVNLFQQSGKQERRIDKQGPDGVFTTLPVEKMSAAGERRAPTKAAFTASAGVGNYVAYTLLREIAKKGYSMLAGLLHVADTPQTAACLRNCIEAAVRAATNYTYIVQCKDGTFYTGWTKNLEKRFWAHQNKTGAKYTRAHPADCLVYWETHLTPQAAMRREWQIKQLSREEKLRLIQTDA